jgi:hypothetical protein
LFSTVAMVFIATCKEPDGKASRASTCPLATRTNRPSLRARLAICAGVLGGRDAELDAVGEFDDATFPPTTAPAVTPNGRQTSAKPVVTIAPRGPAGRPAGAMERHVSAPPTAPPAAPFATRPPFPLWFVSCSCLAGSLVTACFFCAVPQLIKATTLSAAAILLTLSSRTSPGAYDTGGSTAEI